MIDINVFRRQYNLPANFGITLFETKDFTGLASLDHSGDALNTLRNAVLNDIPPQIETDQLLSVMAQLGKRFSEQLYAVNDRIGLKAVEIDFAASAFSDVCQTYAYALLQAKATRHSSPTFDAIYIGWLTSTTRISQTAYDYPHENEVWKIHVLNTAYGRVGLAVMMPKKTVYVRDARYGCPAEQFMYTLLSQVIIGIRSAWV